jgi:hypothetical protein
MLRWRQRHSELSRLLVAASVAAALGLACSSQKNVASGDGDLVWAVEGELQNAEIALDAGNKADARAAMDKVRDLLASPELKHDPDRHQLAERLEWLGHRLAGRTSGTVVTNAPPPPAPVAAAEEEEEEEAPAPQPTLAASAPDMSGLFSASEVENDRDAGEAFRSGPVQGHSYGFSLLAKAKRTKSKSEKAGIYAEAELQLSSCAEEGSALLRDHPELKAQRFKAGKAELRADLITKACKKKLKWVRKALATKKTKRPRFAASR